MITVKELIAFLQTKDQNLPVLYALHSDNTMLELTDIEEKEFVQRHERDTWFTDVEDYKWRKMEITGKRFRALKFPGN